MHQQAFGNRHAAGLQQALGHVFVAGNFFGNRRGLVGLGGPDAPLRFAVAQLHQVARSQTQVGNVARGGGVHDVRRAGAQAQRIHHVLQLGDRRRDVESCVIDGSQHQFPPQLQRAPPHVRLAGAKSYLVHTTLGGFARFAETGAHAAQVLQFQADVFQNVRRPGALVQALQKPTPHARAAFVLHQAGQPGAQPVNETREGVGGIVFELANVHPCLDDRAVGPHIGATQVGHPHNLDIFLLGHAIRRAVNRAVMGLSSRRYSRRTPPRRARASPWGIVGSGPGRHTKLRHSGVLTEQGVFSMRGLI